MPDKANWQTTKDASTRRTIDHLTHPFDVRVHAEVTEEVEAYGWRVWRDPADNRKARPLKEGVIMCPRRFPPAGDHPADDPERAKTRREAWSKAEQAVDGVAFTKRTATVLARKILSQPRPPQRDKNGVTVRCLRCGDNAVLRRRGTEDLEFLVVRHLVDDCDGDRA